MKILKVCMSLLLLGIFLIGCAHVASPVFGTLYVGVTGPVDVEGSGDAPKVGKACATSILGIIATGDAGIEAAKKAGGIKEVVVVDFTATSILGIYAEFCTIVRGR